MWTTSVAPRKLQLFKPDNGGDCYFENVGAPLVLANGLPESGESLVCQYLNPNSSIAIRQRFYNNFHIFLNAPGGGSVPAGEPITRIPEEQLLASASMAAILSGEVHPGTYEFLTQVASDQNSKYFQTILGDVKIKTVALVSPSELLPEQIGKFYDLEFVKVGSNTNTKVVRSDIIEISKYLNRASDFALSVYCAPGAITAQFGKLTTTQLGVVDSQMRQDIVAWVKDMNFYC
jgi:hypothetical protein